MGFSVNDDVYAPCSCGSGKKYKFCCLTKHREERQKTSRRLFWDRGGDPLVVMDLEEAEKANEQGLSLLAAGKCPQAVAAFMRCIRLAPIFPAPHNNLALAFVHMGQVDEAVHRLEEVDGQIDPGNVFTLGSLVHLYLLLGRREQAEATAERLRNSRPANQDARLKQCEALAMLGRHEDVLAAAMDHGQGTVRDPQLAFFAGAALANLGRYGDAEHELAAAVRCRMRGQRAKRYLKLLRTRIAPDTLFSDWPYIEAGEWTPHGLLERLLATRRIKGCPGVVEGILVVIDDRPRGAERFVALLGEMATARAVEILKRITTSTYGPDSLRMAAHRELVKLREVPSGGPLNVWLGGEWKDLTIQEVEITPEPVYEIAPELGELMMRLVAANRSGDHALAEKLGRELVARAPDCPPAYQNLSVALHCLGKLEEEEAMLRKAVALDPGYLFAPATLAMRRIQADRLEEARAILGAVRLPRKIHGPAYASLLGVHLQLAVLEKRSIEAAGLVRVLQKLAPDSPLLAGMHGFELKTLLGQVEKLHARARRRERLLRWRLFDPEANVAECLRGYASDRLRAMAEQLAVPGAEGLGRRKAVAAIAARFQDRELVRGLVESLPEASRGALRELRDAGGRMPHEEFTRRHGSDEKDLGSPAGKPLATALGQLKALALAAEGTVQGRQCVMAPREVVAAL